MVKEYELIERVGYIYSENWYNEFADLRSFKFVPKKLTVEMQKMFIDLKVSEDTDNGGPMMIFPPDAAGHGYEYRSEGNDHFFPGEIGFLSSGDGISSPEVRFGIRDLRQLMDL